jgi:hypothetical protein
MEITDHPTLFRGMGLEGFYFKIAKQELRSGRLLPNFSRLLVNLVSGLILVFGSSRYHVKSSSHVVVVLT